MQDAKAIERIRDKYVELLDDLDERGRRRWAAVEARALGRGGVTAVALATGLSARTIRTGLKELRWSIRSPAIGSGDVGPVANRPRPRNPACGRPWIG